MKPKAYKVFYQWIICSWLLAIAFFSIAAPPPKLYAQVESYSDMQFSPNGSLMGNLSTITGNIHIFNTTNGRLVSEINSNATGPFSSWCFTSEPNTVALFNGETVSFINALTGTSQKQFAAGPVVHCFPGVGPVKIKYNDDDSADLSTYTTGNTYTIKKIDATTTLLPVGGQDLLLLLNKAEGSSAVDRFTLEIYDTGTHRTVGRTKELQISFGLWTPSIAVDASSRRVFYLETDFELQGTLEELDKPRTIRVYDYSTHKAIEVKGVTNLRATGLQMLKGGKLIVSDLSTQSWSVHDTRSGKIIEKGEGEISGVDMHGKRNQFLVTPPSGDPYFMSANGKLMATLPLFKKGYLEDIFSAGEHVWISSATELRYLNLKDFETRNMLSDSHLLLAIDRRKGSVLVGLNNEESLQIASVSPDGAKAIVALPSEYVPTGVATKLIGGWLVNSVSKSDNEKILHAISTDINHIADHRSDATDIQRKAQSFYYFLSDDGVLSDPTVLTGVPDAMAYSPTKKIVALKEGDKINTYTWPGMQRQLSVQMRNDDVASIFLSPDGEVALTAGTHGAEAISLSSGKVISKYYGNFSTSEIVLKNNETAYLINKNTLALWNYRLAPIRGIPAVPHLQSIAPNLDSQIIKSGEDLVITRSTSGDSSIVISSDCIKPLRWSTNSDRILCKAPKFDSPRENYSVIDPENGKTVSSITHYGINKPFPLMDKTGELLVYVAKRSVPPSGSSRLSTLAFELTALNTKSNTETLLLANAREVVNAAISSNGNYIAIVEQSSDNIMEDIQNYKITIISTSNGSILATFNRNNTYIYTIAITDDGRYAVTTGAGEITKIDTQTKSDDWVYKYPFAKSASLVNEDREILALSIMQKDARLLSFTTGKEARRFAVDSAQSRLMLSGESLLLLNSTNKDIEVLHDTNDLNPPLQTLITETQTIRKVRRIDATHLMLVRDDGQLSLYDERTASIVARMFLMGSGGFVVATDDGRFDASNMDDIAALHWVRTEAPGDAIPIETFLAELYEPQLLWKVLNNSKLESLPPVSSPRTSLPISVIRSISIPYPDAAEIEVQITSGEKGDAEGNRIADVKLFRDSKLIGVSHVSDRGGNGDKSLTVRFPDIQLPPGPKNQEIEFSAYAFNKEGLKGPTTRTKFATPAHVDSPPRQVHLIAIGVDHYANPDFNLNYAAADAIQFYDRLSSVLTRNAFPVNTQSRLLLSPATMDALPPTKDNIRAAVSSLTRKKASPQASSANSNSLTPFARTVDSIIIFYSGHGYFSQDGQLFIFPSDVSNESLQGRQPSDSFLKSAISTSELAEWMEGIDALEITLILDACHSAGAVGANFRPGPLASRGLGQLAYDKGMRILAATQADSVALETDELKHGYLSYALIQDGLDKALADFRPVDGVIWINEWLAYGRKRVPELASGYTNASGNQKDGSVQPRLFRTRGDTASGELAQRPVLYDFSRTPPMLRLSSDKSQ